MTTLTKIVDLLQPLTSDERDRIVKAALMVLGEGIEPATQATLRPMAENLAEENLPPRVQRWMQQNNLTRDEIDEMMYVTEGTAELIGEVPGKGDKEKTYNSYILAGVEAFLTTGEAAFTDKAARKLCDNAGCYNVDNHATYLKQKKVKYFSGTKEKGWRLTGPGLKQAAILMKKSPNP